MTINIEVNCPHCHSVEVVKNGIKKTSKQNLLCKDCSQQFQRQYVYQGVDKSVKATLKRMLLLKPK